jgi:hypothetical protein
VYASSILLNDTDVLSLSILVLAIALFDGELREKRGGGKEALSRKTSVKKNFLTCGSMCNKLRSFL